MAKHLEKSANKHKGGIIAACITGALLLVAAAVFVVSGISAQRMTTIFPGVSLSGAQVGGMTRDKAVSVLSDDEYSAMFYGSVSVQLTEDVVLIVSGSDAGLASTPEDAADIAMAYGRNRGFFGGALSYIKSTVFGTEISLSGMETYDEAAVRNLIASAAKSADTAAIRDIYSILGDELKVYKGASGASVDEAAVYDLIYNAFFEKNYALIQYVPDENEIDSVDFNAIYDDIYKEPVSAYYDKETDAITHETVGVSFDTDSAQKLYDKAAYGTTVTIPLVITQPKDTYTSLSELIFRDILAEKSTTMYTSSSNRINNISLAAAAIDGSVLMPGEEFSFNGIVGERTSAKGYKAAGAYVGGQTVEQIGGGICQVSSTIYYCSLLADLEITSRSNHMFNVAYLPLGMDATVNWGTIDFKFKNDKDYPIKINATVQDKILYVTIYGTKTDDTYVKLQYELLKTIPNETIEQVDDTLKAGETKVKTSGHTGYIVNVYKYIYDGEDNLIETVFLSKDTYKKLDKVVLVGPAEEQAPPAGETPITETPGTDTPADGTAGTDTPA
ncbi:MAG: VanW family protein, partial [Oscillospiraceae bacterium]